MAFVEGVLVEDLDIEVPVAGNAVVTVQQLDARRQTVLVDLRGARRAASVRLPVDRAREEGRERRERTLPSSLTRRLSLVAPAMIDRLRMCSGSLGID